jgi:hypothetical protein
LQQQQLANQQEEQRQQAELAATSALAQLYAALYATDRAKYDEEHQEEWRRREAGDPEADPSLTAISLMYRHIHRLNGILKNSYGDRETGLAQSEASPAWKTLSFTRQCLRNVTPFSGRGNRA